MAPSTSTPPPAALALATPARLPAMDCVRALVTLSQLARSAVLVSAAFLPLSGKWARALGDLRLHATLGGGFQPDILLLLSGVLLGSRLRALSNDPAEGMRVVAGRLVRLWPGLLLLVALSLLGGDCTSLRPAQLASSVLLLSYNLTDVRWALSAVLPAVWHLCVDFQAAAAFTLLLGCLHLALPDRAAWLALSKFVVALSAATSLVVRFIAFHATTASLSQLAKSLHPAQQMTSTCVAWAERELGPGFKWRTPFDARRAGLRGMSATAAAETVHSNFGALVASPSLRFGPMALGILLALMLASDPAPPPPPPKAQPGALAKQPAPPAPPTRLHLALGWLKRTFWTAQALATLAVFSLPFDTWAGTEQERMMTVIGPFMAAAAAALLLFLALCPPASSWHSAPLAAFMGWRGWAPLAAASFHINLLHVPFMLRLAAWRAPLPKQVGAAFALSLAATTLAALCLFSLLFTRLVERPLRRLLTSLLLRKRAVAAEKAKAE